MTMKTIAAFAIASGLAWAVPSFQFSPVTDMPTAHSTRIYWTSAAAATSTLKYGLTAAYGTTMDLTSGSWGNGKLWVWSITGLAASTTYHYTVCLNDGAELCSTDATFTTLAQGSTTPNLPSTVDTTMPTQTGTTRTVASNCSDFASIYTASTWGDVIEIPPGATCNSTYSLPGKVHGPSDGWIVIRPTTYASLPAAGTRIQPSDEANMFTLTHRGAGVGDWRSGTAIVGATCDDGNQPGNTMIDWTHGTSPMPLVQCQPSATTKSITAATYLTSNTATLAITGHGGLVNQTFWISGATSTSSKLAALMNGGGMITAVPDADHLTVKFWRTDSTASTDTYTGSGVLALNFYTTVTYTSGVTNPVGACTDGAYYYNTATATDIDHAALSMWYCGTDSAWHNFANQSQQTPLLDLRTAKYIRIIGAIFTHLPPMTDPLLNRYAAHHSHVNRYTSMEAFVVESYQTSHVILDRCWFKGWDQARVNLAMNMHGDNVAFINSRISEWSWWVGTADPDKQVDTEAGGIYPQTGPGPGLIHNNYLEVGGITIHFDDSYAHNAPAANNYTITRNTFYRPPKWFYGHASSNGRMYFHRHFLEWKVGNTVLAKGNTFDGNWRTLNRGEAIILGFRSGGWYATCSWSSNTASCGKAHFLEVGDLVTLDDTTIRTVATTSDSSHFTLDGAAIADGNHAVNQLNHDTSIADITIESNTISNVPNAFAIFGVQDNYNMKGRATARVAFKNNLVYNVDQLRKLPVMGDTPGEGSMALVYVGVEDTTVEHNTFICSGTCREPLVGGIQVTGSATAKNSGMVVRNNLLYGGDYSCYIADSTGGSAGLNLAWNNWTFSKNVLFRAGGDPTGCPTGNFWHNTSTLGAVPFDSDYRLTSLYRAAYACIDTPGDCTTDATDSGVNITTLLAAQSGDTPPPAPSRAPSGKLSSTGRIFSR